MHKVFNVTGDCKPDIHYMADITEKLKRIKEMVDAGQYFTINRARQYGKTTTLHALAQYLQEEYLVLSLDFQLLSSGDFADEKNFVEAFAREIVDVMENEQERRKKSEVQSDDTQIFPENIADAIGAFSEGTAEKLTLSSLFYYLSDWCRQSTKPMVLIIDEVDAASNNQVFLDFLAQLRGYYIRRDKKPTFQSVILAGVYDIRNLKQKISPDGEHRQNSPWNIAADFLVDMSFSVEETKSMLVEYEQEYHTGMDIDMIARWICDYTAGYPYLVSRICKIVDERVAGNARFPDKKAAWTKEGLLESVNILLNERNTLFESLVNKLTDYPELKEMLHQLLFMGKSIVYNPLNTAIAMAEMFGFIKNAGGNAVIANRIFEMVLYNLFLSQEMQTSDLYKAALQTKNQFIENGHLNMKKILEKFVEHFDEIYGDQDDTFLEADGRRFFLLYLRPIINGTGNYYVEAQTRNMERTDVIVDYRGEQFVIELKIWRGNEYNTRGEKQLSAYLDYYHLEKGYMLSFNFNKKKQVGVKEIVLGDKILIEAVV